MIQELSPNKERDVLQKETASRKIIARISTLAGAIAFLSALSPSLTETAVANGETRTINLYHTHTREEISATYLVNGQYDQSVLKQLNWFLRDWRRDEPTNMDPRLFDVVWEAYRHAGATETIHVVSAYRSPETNAMLRRRSRAVAKYSQHMLGKAMDTTMPGMSMSNIREIGMRMQRGGVGYYPTAGTPFVHLDVGNVRSWPRMTYDQLARLFPDGKTVHLPTNGQPLARYEEARAEIEARGGGAYVPTERRSRGFLAFLFGGGGEDDEDSGEAAPAPSTRKQWASLAPRNARGAATQSDEESGASANDASGRRGRPDALARAESDLPRGETQMTAAPQNAGTQQPEATGKSSDANAPLPPNRPSSLGNANNGRVTLASLESNETAKDAGDRLSEDMSDSSNGALTAPLPPRRPAGLSVLASLAPMPPLRPADLAQLSANTPAAAKTSPTAIAKKEADANAATALAKLIDVTGTTRVRPTIASTDLRAGIPANAEPQGAQEDAAKREPDDAALAYAAPSSAAQSDAAGTRSESPTGLRAAAKSATGKTELKRTGLVPARLDRSNFHALTSVTPASRFGGSSVLGSAISAPRMAARVGPSVLREDTGTSYVSTFVTQTAAPSVEHFAPAH